MRVILSVVIVTSVLVLNYPPSGDAKSIRASESKVTKYDPDPTHKQGAHLAKIREEVENMTWEKYNRKHLKHYDDPEEEDRRRKYFLEEKERVLEWNRRGGWPLGFDDKSDWSEEEIDEWERKQPHCTLNGCEN